VGRGRWKISLGCLCAASAVLPGLGACLRPALWPRTGSLHSPSPWWCPRPRARRALHLNKFLLYHPTHRHLASHLACPGARSAWLESYICSNATLEEACRSLLD